MSSYFLTQTLAEEACEEAVQAFCEAAAGGIVNKGVGAFVIVDPTEPYVYQGSAQADFDHFLTKAVLNIVRVNTENEKWNDKYVHIATSKAFLSWRTGLPSRRLQHEFAYQARMHETGYGGSFIDDGGLIVAFSGVHPQDDESFAEFAAARCRARAQRLADDYREKYPDDSAFGMMGWFDWPEGFDPKHYKGHYVMELRCPVCDSREGIYPLDRLEDGALPRRCVNCGHEGSYEDFLAPNHKKES